MHQVNDVCWSPLSSTAFAAVTADGRLDLWDLESSTLDPVASAHLDAPLSAVAFASVDPVVVAGSSDGQIHVFRVYGSAASARTRALSLDEQRERLVATIAPSPLAEIS
jgi:dynein intermediate chain 1